MLNKKFPLREAPYYKFLSVALLFTFVCSILIAAFVTMLEVHPKGGVIGFWQNLLFSEAIGLLSCFFVVSMRNIFRPEHLLLVVLSDFSSLILGYILGRLSAALLLGHDLSFFFNQFDFTVKTLAISLSAGFMITYFFMLNTKMSEVEVMAQEERIRRLTSEKGLAEANLKLLQAQIEPHFLFNTLSNIMTLLDRDSEKGKTMLADLTHYLRLSLSMTRQEKTTVGQEMALIEDYLRIYQVRMGERLRFDIDIPDEIRELPLHPMLIQPLVENAIRHGLEPEIKGGEIRITGSIQGSILRFEIIDNGAGLYENSSSGMGIDNVRRRLEAIYGDKGRLILKDNIPTGVNATIEVPYESNKSDHRG